MDYLLDKIKYFQDTVNLSLVSYFLLISKWQVSSWTHLNMFGQFHYNNQKDPVQPQSLTIINLEATFNLNIQRIACI